MQESSDVGFRGGERKNLTRAPRCYKGRLTGPGIPQLRGAKEIIVLNRPNKGCQTQRETVRVTERGGVRRRKMRGEI